MRMPREWYAMDFDAGRVKDQIEKGWERRFGRLRDKAEDERKELNADPTMRPSRVGRVGQHLQRGVRDSVARCCATAP